jgi:microcystin-dependent protein
MSDSYIGEIRAFAFNYVPQGWLGCDGSRQPISQYVGLYAIIGPRFGGDGKTYFNLPDLRGRAVASQATNALTPPNPQGYSTMAALWGVNSVNLNYNQIPTHIHGAKGYGGAAGVTQVGTPDNTVYLGLLRGVGTVAYDLWSTNAASGEFPDAALAPAGGGQPHTNNQPYLPLNFCINWDGYFMPNPN